MYNNMVILVLLMIIMMTNDKNSIKYKITILSQNKPELTLC